MKTLILFLVTLYAFGNTYSQNASAYFPANTGYKWYYKNTPLDSNNNPITNLARYRIDSFAVVAEYNGLTASIVRIKDNLNSFMQNSPYNDTSYYNFQTTNGWKYVTISMIPDTNYLPLGLLNFLRSFQNWYSVYRFAQTVNQEYIIVSKDTTIAFDTLTIPIRVKIIGKRFNDETVTTVNGTYTAKKFATILGLYYRLLIFEIPLVEIPDTVWLAQNVWMVKEIIPSTKIDLSSVGIGINIPIPGRIYEPENSVGIQEITLETPGKYYLYQNYPNPFNPVTRITFDLKDACKTKLTIYGAEGREIEKILNEDLPSGRYSITFDGTQYSSGVYFYRIEAGEYRETKKMVLIR